MYALFFIFMSSKEPKFTLSKSCTIPFDRFIYVSSSELNDKSNKLSSSLQHNYKKKLL